MENNLHLNKGSEGGPEILGYKIGKISLASLNYQAWDSEIDTN